MTGLLADLRARGVYRTGHFRLSGGGHSDTYLQCALALQDPVFAADLGRMLVARLHTAGIQAGTVASPAIGGLLAGFVVAGTLGARFVFTERQEDGMMTLRRGQTVGRGERVVVVDDVLTTGGSATETAAVITARGGQVVGYGAIIDRSTLDQPLPFEAHALVRVTARTWAASDCPLCVAGEPLDVPGTRPGSPVVHRAT